MTDASKREADIVVQSLSHVRLFATLWTAACQASLSINSSRSPPKSMSIESVMPSNHLILCHPFLLMPSIFPSIRGLLLCCWKRVFAMTSVFSWQNSISLCPASFCTPRPNLPVTPGVSWVPTFAFEVAEGRKRENKSILSPFLIYSLLPVMLKA